MKNFYLRCFGNIGMIGVGVACALIAARDLLKDLSTEHVIDEIAKEKAAAWSRAVNDGNREARP